MNKARKQQRGWPAWIIRSRVLILVAVGALAAVSAYYSSRVKFDSSVEGWFLEDDPSYAAYNKFLERFTGDEISVIAIFAPDVFDPKVLGAVDRLTRAAGAAPYAHRVQSLTNVKIFDNDGEALEIRRLVRRLPTTAAEAGALRRHALQNPLLVGTLLDKGAGVTTVVVELTGGPDLMTRKVAQAEALQEAIRQENLRAAAAGAEPPYRLSLSGTPVLDKAFYDYNERDFRLMLPTCTVVVLLLAFLIFRNWLMTVIPMMVVSVALLLVFGLMGALGIEANILSSMVAVLILAVGVADAVHVLSDYRRHLGAGLPRAEALERTIRDLFIPCLFTSITTAAGFLSLLYSDLQPVREAGGLAALGVTLAFALSMTLVPAVLSFFHISPAKAAGGRVAGWVDALALRLGSLSRLTNLRVLLVSAGLVLVVLVRLAVGGMDVGTNPLEYFRKGDAVRIATEEIDLRLGGTTSVELTIHAKNEGLKDPRVLRKIDDLQRWFERLPGVTRALSVVDYLKELNRVLHGGHRRHFKLPDSREAVAQYYLLLEGEEDFDSMVQDNYSLGRMTARVSFSDADALSRKLPMVERRLAQEFAGEDVRASLTGFVKLMGDMETYLIRSQIRSMLIAFCVITVMMFILLRSVRLGLFAMIPNLVPIILGLGFMAAVGISLDPGTVMIGSIALGLVVDDTVHFLVQLKRQRRKEGADMQAAIISSIRISGKPIITTSIILVAGFCVSTLGSFNPNVHFGLISAVIIVLALIADLVMLPAALRILGPKI